MVFLGFFLIYYKSKFNPFRIAIVFCANCILPNFLTLLFYPTFFSPASNFICHETLSLHLSGGIKDEARRLHVSQSNVARDHMRRVSLPLSTPMTPSVTSNNYVNLCGSFVNYITHINQYNKSVNLKHLHGAVAVRRTNPEAHQSRRNH